MAARLKQLLTSGELILAPGVFEMFSARIADRMGFNALYAPPNTPAATVATLNQALAKIMTQADVKEKLNVMGFLPVGKSPQELIDRQNASAKKWEPIIKASGFTAD